MEGLNATSTAVFVFFFVLVTVLGFVAARWKSGDLGQLHEWGLGGRRFGPWITWFLIGGDLYTAYTLIAVPGAIYARGAFGFFAVPYTVIIYPFLYLVIPRLWLVTHRHNYLTAGDFVGGRYGNRWLELAVALTGILATMPYIALQLVGIEKAIAGLGFQGEGLAGDAPLIIAFIILAVFTYQSGLRAPAMIAFVKDLMIYVFILAAVTIIPAQLGGYAAVFDAAAAGLAKKGAGLTLAPAQIAPYVTLAIGSAMALLLYPHSLTGILSASGPDALKRNAVALPAYSFLLGLIGLLGILAYGAGIDTKDANNVVPLLILKSFPDWFAGFCFAAIAVGALVPAAVMSIGAANTFTRNVWKPFVEPGMSPAKETFLAKLVSLIVKVGALAVILFVPTKNAIDLQLLGGVWMIQVFPAVIFGLYTRWFNGWALLIGWAVGMVLATWLSYGPTAWVAVHPVFELFTAYNGFTAVAVNIAIAGVLSAVWRSAAPDETMVTDYAETPLTAS